MSESGPKIIPSVPDDFDFAKDKEEITFGHVELSPKDFSKFGSEITQQQVMELSIEEREKLEYREKNNSWLKVSDRRVGPGALDDAEWDLAVRAYSAGYENLVDKEVKEKKPEVVEAVKKYDEVMVAKDHGTEEEYRKAKEELEKTKENLMETSAFEPPPTLHHLDEHPKEMSLDYIQRQVEKAKYQGGLSKYYWEEKLKEAKAAEKEKEKEIVKKMATDEAREQAVENLKQNKKETWGEKFKNSVKSHYESGKEKAKSKWPFWKERLKGAATVSFLEFHHAEKFRLVTKDVGLDTAAQSRLVKVEDYVTFDEMNKVYRKAGLGNNYKEMLEPGIIPTSKETGIKMLNEVSNAILGDKISYNQKLEDSIVADAKSQLGQRLEKYIGTGGIKGLTPEKWAQIEEQIRQSTGGIRKNRILDEMTDYIKLYRQSFDAGENRWSKWKMRYVYGAIELALWATGAALIWSKLGGIGAPGGGPTGLEGGPVPGPESMPQTGLDPMDKNVWNTIDQIANNEYGLDLNNQQLVDFSKEAVQNNNIGVNVWDIPGNPLDTGMQSGHPLDLSSVRQALANLVGR